MKYEMHAGFMCRILLQYITIFSFICTNLNIFANGGACK